MYEYRTSVSFMGQFCFRTDWDDDKDRANDAYDKLDHAFGADHKVEMIRRSLILERTRSNVE